VALIIVALVQGGLRLVSFVVVAILAYAVVFAAVATFASGIRRLVNRTAEQTAAPAWEQFASHFWKSLVEGPVFILSFW
jgi:hypothetical protein